MCLGGSRGAIELASIPYLIETKEFTSLPIRDSATYFDEYAPSFQGFMRGKVAIVSAAMSLEPLGSRVVPFGLPLAMVLLMVLPTLLGFGTKSPGLRC